MLLTADIGNTGITLGAYKNDKLVFTSRILTDKSKDTDGYIEALADIFKEGFASAAEFSGAVISSVVPEVTTAFSQAVEKLTGKAPLTAGEKYNGSLKVDILPVSYLGADLIAASVGAISKYPLPCLVADLGTATKILVIDKKGVSEAVQFLRGLKSPSKPF